MSATGSILIMMSCGMFALQTCANWTILLQSVPWRDIVKAYPYDDHRLREKLASLENNHFMIEHSGSGRGTVYRLSRRAAAVLNKGTAYDLTRRLDKEAIKVRILTLLKDRPLKNSEICEFTDLERQQVTALLKELESEGQIVLGGHGAGAQWQLRKRNN